MPAGIINPFLALLSGLLERKNYSREGLIWGNTVCMNCLWLCFIFSTSSRRIELMSFQAFDPPPIPTRIKEAAENNASNTSLGKKYFWNFRIQWTSNAHWAFYYTRVHKKWKNLKNCHFLYSRTKIVKKRHRLTFLKP